MTEELLFKDRYLFVLSKANACLSPRSVIDKNVMSRFNSIEIESLVGFFGVDLVDTALIEPGEIYVFGAPCCSPFLLKVQVF